MSIAHLLVYLAIALVCGLVGQAIAGRSIGGYIASTVVGLAGAFVGSWLARELRLSEPLLIHVGGRSFPVLWAIVGAAVLTFVWSLLRHRVARRG